MRLLKIGRDMSCDIVLHSDKVSSLHAEITLLNSGDILLEDKNSHNGTYVMNQPIAPGKPVNIKRGDAIRFADVELQWSQVPMPEDNSAYKAIYGIGTNFNNDIQISGATVSRYHATIKHGKDGKIYIFDHSKNGTTVDGIKITPNSPYRIKKKSAITCGGVPVDLSTRLPWPQSIWKPIATIAAAVIVLAGLGLGIKAIGKPSKYDDSELYAMYNNSVVFLQGVYHYKATGIPEEILKKYNFPVDFFIDREGTIRDVNSVPTETVTQNCSYSGTGFFISNDGKLITNLHVVKPWLFENTKNQVELIYKRQFAAKLDYYNKLTGGEYGIQTGEAAYTSLIKIEGVLDAIYLIPQGRYFSNENAIRCRVLLAEDNIENDIALIQSDKGELPAKCRFVNITDSIDTGNETLTVGKHVYTIGFPRGYDGFIQDYKSKGLQAVASGGSIIQADKQYHFGYNAPTTGGASGSPVFNEQGMLIGVHHAGLSGIDTQGYNYGIKAKYVKELIDKYNNQ